MNFAWNGDTITFALNLTFIILLYAFLLFVMIRVNHRLTSFLFLGVSFALNLTAYLLGLNATMIIVTMVSIVGLSLIANANQGDLYKFVANPFKRLTARSGKFGVEKIFDSKQFYHDVETAVLKLSEDKTGALITFERGKTLKNLMKNGVPVNAPLSPELLWTIFYPGTRLHDGAVVVHGNHIVAASVFFALTTQPYAVKYGSRHRAAIGISEVSDAVTVVVSEETGRISIAVNGQLQPVDPEDFLRVFENYMSDDNGDEE